MECEKCGEDIGIFDRIRGKKFYIYPGNEKGSLEITEEKIICEDCLPKPMPEEKAQKLVLRSHEEKYEEALEVLESFFNEERAKDWYNKGNLLANLGKLEQALECYNQALFLDTHYAKAWYRKGCLLFEFEEYEDAAQCFTNVVNLDEEFSQKCKPGEFPHEDYLEVVEEDSKIKLIPKTWAFASLLNEGIAHIKAGDPDMAEAVFGWLYTIIGDIPPFDSIHINDFSRYCIENRNRVLDLLEPQVIATVTEPDQKH